MGTEDNAIELQTTMNKDDVLDSRASGRVEMSRTVTKNFQGIRFAIAFSYPNSVKLSQARDLAEFLVRVQITRSWTEAEAEKYAGAYAACHDEPISEFLNPLKSAERTEQA